MEHSWTTTPLAQAATGEKTKARNLLAAIRILKLIEGERRSATPDERQVLMRFPGFGPVALGIFPDPVTGRFKDASWQALGEELMALLAPDEYASAKRSTYNAFYTSPIVVGAIHQAISRLGVPDNALILEPGCGIGNFLRQGPKERRFVGVELDLISGQIARLLQPTHEIRIENFRDTKLSEGGIDAVIGNVPFANVQIEHRGVKRSLHDFFLAKSIDALKPGGILAMVTTHFTLDKQNAATREYLSQHADFLGAIRLPSDAFKQEGTSVVTDILFLRKRAEGQPAAHVDPDWLEVAPLQIKGAEVPVNRYFLNHPEMVLGAWSRDDTLYGEGYSVASTGDLGRQLQAAIQRLPQFPTFPASTVPIRNSSAHCTQPPGGVLAEGSFCVRDDQVICQMQDAQLVPVTYGGQTLRANGTMTGKRLAALIGLRDLARRVLLSQNEGWPDPDRQDARRQLNWAYDRFTSLYGPINKTTFSESQDGSVIRRCPNLVKFREDPDAMLVMSLEDYDDVTGKAAKAAIMLKDVVGRKPPITSVQSAEEGLLVSLNQLGKVDLPHIASLYGKAEDQVIAELGTLIFHDPQSKTWQTADQYLSGNVREKLAAAERAGLAYSRNAEALREVQPEDVLPSDIDAHLGAPWIPVSDVQAFATQLFRAQEGGIQIGHLPQDALWSVDADYATEQSVAATSEFGTQRAGGPWLLDLALNMKTPTIYDTKRVGGKEERIVNQDATLAAREKQKLIKERFRSWLFDDPDRTERLVRLYNDTYNNLRTRHFDGSHLDYPGMNQTVKLRPHQNDAVWRGISSGNTLLAHAVGAGKTFTMAASGMKMKQAGLIKKPMYVVPNHLLEQFAREFMQLYPNARLLVAGKEDLSRDKRKHLTAKIASGDWDGIIVTHSSFERIGMSLPYQEQFLKEQIQAYDRLLCEGASKGANRAQRNLIKAIEKQKAAREERLKELLAEDKKDDGLVFDELGVDHLFIDEAHYFKNLETPTKMERVAGVQTGGSERAFDLYMKARYLHQLHPGHGVTFATGTPISNTMVELYTMQRFLDPEEMRQRGIEHFDAWAATFGEVVDTMEISPDGATLRPRSRFARFTNLPELQQMFRAFADVQTAQKLDLPRPKLEGGKPMVVACPMSEAQRELQGKLVERYDRLRSQKIDPRVDNALAITTDGRKLALDARMLSAGSGDFPGSKVNALVENAAAIWQKSEATRGTQMIFCDLGVHSTAWGYSVYDELVAKLVAKGIPRSQIAAIGDADSDAKKRALFEQVRKGSVRILIGSTQKMGTGTNVQRRLVALHHLDAPWKPAEVEQRDGRILRQGNENAEVAIYRYVTEGSFDAYMWQALETKAKFISQIMSGDIGVRQAEDIGGQEFSYAEVKAIATGNPAVLTLAEADAEIQRLTVLKKQHLDEQFLARRSVKELPGTIERLTKRLSNLETDKKTLATHADDPMTIGNRLVTSSEVSSVLAHALNSLPINVSETRSDALGIYQGLSFGLLLHPHFGPEVYLEGAATCRSGSLTNHGARAVFNALDRLAKDYDSECSRAQRDLKLAEGKLRDYRARLGQSFAHDSRLTELTSRRDQLKAALSGIGAHSNSADAADTDELSQQIKSLLAFSRTESPAEHSARLSALQDSPARQNVESLLETTRPAYRLGSGKSR